jgi:23S rRNA (guanosine2251-2'-O)-methyltransferase
MEKKKIITGRNPVIEYLNSIEDGSGMELHLSSSAHGKIIIEIQHICRRKKVKIISEDKAFFKDVSSSSTHQGVALHIPPAKKESDPFEVLKQVAADKGTIILLDQITDPHNLGSIIRSAEALGCGAVILPKNNSAEVNETVIKTSAGATAHIEIITIVNVAQFLDELKDLGFWIVGTSDHGTIPVTNLKDVHPACIIIGSEGKGMRRLTEEKCDYIVSIPLKGKVSSLNASVAAAIVMYEVLKSS